MVIVSSPVLQHCPHHRCLFFGCMYNNPLYIISRLKACAITHRRERAHSERVCLNTDRRGRGGEGGDEKVVEVGMVMMMNGWGWQGVYNVLQSPALNHHFLSSLCCRSDLVYLR